MNVSWLNWRVLPWGWSARGFLCQKCWAKLQPFITDSEEQSGMFVVQWHSPDNSSLVVRFKSKGYEAVDGPCSACGGELDDAEEVNFYVDRP